MDQGQANAVKAGGNLLPSSDWYSAARTSAHVARAAGMHGFAQRVQLGGELAHAMVQADDLFADLTYAACGPNIVGDEKTGCA